MISRESVDELRGLIGTAVAHTKFLQGLEGRSEVGRHLALVATHLEDAALRARAASEDAAPTEAGA